MQLHVEPISAGQRLDHFLQANLTQYTRSRLQDWIKSGRVLVDGREAKSSLTLKGGELIDVSPADPPPLKAEAEDIPLKVLYEDEAVVVIDKPAGMVVHAGAGVHDGTLVNALLHHFESLSTVGGDLRPGIVHRLDKETSGVLLVAKTDAAHQAMAAQFSDRTVEKIYLALVNGLVRMDNGRIDKLITRDPNRRTRMTAKLEHGRTALTDYKVLNRFQRHTFVEVKIGTGRTHQIRVHMATLGHPIYGDRLYGAPKIEGFDRFFLHAHRLSFDSPATSTRVTVVSQLPPDLEDIMKSEAI